MKSNSSQRSLGPFTVSSIGLGCMNLSHAYGIAPRHRWPAGDSQENLRGQLAPPQDGRHRSLLSATNVIAIPGTTSETHLQENLGAAAIDLEPDLIALLDAHINERTVVGECYNSTTQAESDTENF